MGATFKEFIEPARERNQLWRVFCTLLLVVAVEFGAIFAVAHFDMIPGGVSGRIPDTPAGVTFMLLTFVPWIAALDAALWIFHRRGLLSVFGKFSPKGFGIGLLIAAALAAISIIVELAFAGAPPRSPLPLHVWAVDALIVIPLILIQTGAEEAIFRGYLMQQLFARFRSMLIRVVLPTVLFGLMHWNPDLSDGSGAIMLAAGFAGFALALITIRTGNLYMAWGVHFGINLSAILLVSPTDYLSGLALFHWTDEAVFAELAQVDAALTGAFALVIWLLIRVRRGG